MKRDGKLGWEILCLAALSCPLFACVSCVAAFREDKSVPIIVALCAFVMITTALLVIREKN